MKINPAWQQQAEIVASLRDGIAAQRRQINELNKMIWTLVHKQGGSFSVPQDELVNIPEHWLLQAQADDDHIIHIKATVKESNEVVQN